jgi:transposase
MENPPVEDYYMASVKHVRETMDIGTTAIRRWLERYGTEQNGWTGIGKPLTPEQRRIRQLEQDLSNFSPK